MELLSTISFDIGTLTVLGSHIDRPYGYNLGLLKCKSTEIEDFNPELFK